MSIYLYLCLYKPWHKGDYPKMYPTFLKIFIYDINCTTSLFFYLKISGFICIHLMGQNTHNRIYCFNTTDYAFYKWLILVTLLGNFQKSFFLQNRNSVSIKIGTELNSLLFLQSVQSLSCVLLFATPWTASCQASLCITNSRSLLKLVSFESVMPSSHLFL